jgi:YbgC/YbaW family acyl-CoA thioester hydrolase|tara:strand:+ start:205 stop:654 length:450 start_codon:yes stop_codon:yes gene_type:complete
MSNNVIIAEKVVEFAETDAAGLVHFSNYFRYVEIAERTLFESLGEHLLDDAGPTLAGFPRLRANCDFSAPLAFGDRARIELKISEVTEKSIHYSFRILKRTGEDEWSRAAKGEMITVYACKEKPGGAINPQPIPASLRSKLAAFLAKNS